MTEWYDRTENREWHRHKRSEFTILRFFREFDGGKCPDDFRGIRFTYWVSVRSDRAFQNKSKSRFGVVDERSLLLFLSLKLFLIHTYCVPHSSSLLLYCFPLFSSSCILLIPSLSKDCQQ